MSEIQAIVFDLDDTLYPERAYAMSGFTAVAAAFADRLGDPTETTARLRVLFDTEHRARVFNAILAERGLPEDPDTIRAMIDAYRSHRPTITLHPDADAALTRLRPAYKLGLITDGPAIQQWAKIDALKLRDRFDEIIVTDDLGPGFAKPHPLAFELIRERLDVPHTACAYVADNVAKDFIAPNALGWLTIRVLREDGIYRDVKAAEGGEARQITDGLDTLEDRLR